MIAGIAVSTYVELERPHVLRTPADGLCSAASVRQRLALVEANRGLA